MKLLLCVAMAMLALLAVAGRAEPSASSSSLGQPAFLEQQEAGEQLQLGAEAGAGAEADDAEALLALSQRAHETLQAELALDDAAEAEFDAEGEAETEVDTEADADADSDAESATEVETDMDADADAEGEVEGEAESAAEAALDTDLMQLTSRVGEDGEGEGGDEEAAAGGEEAAAGGEEAAAGGGGGGGGEEGKPEHPTYVLPYPPVLPGHYTPLFNPYTNVNPLSTPFANYAAQPGAHPGVAAAAAAQAGSLAAANGHIAGAVGAYPYYPYAASPAVLAGLQGNPVPYSGYAGWIHPQNLNSAAVGQNEKEEFPQFVEVAQAIADEECRNCQYN